MAEPIKPKQPDKDRQVPRPEAPKKDQVPGPIRIKPAKN